MQYAIIHGDEDHPLVEKLDFNKSLVKELAAIVEEKGIKIIMTAREPTNHVHEQSFIRCRTCNVCFVSPTTICERCDPRGWQEEQERWRASAISVRAVGMDRYAMSIIAIMPDGRFVSVGDAWNIMRNGEYKHHDDLIRDLTALKKENTELLAENARMRRRLENKKP